jgi:hypothetical protein
MATRATPKKLVLLPPKSKPKVLRKRTGRARGRPPADLDVKTAARVAGLGATIDEIAAALGCGHALIYKRMNSDPVFREAIEEGRAFGRLSLRRMQWQTAQAGNATMLIWLGKQMLDQRDDVHIEHAGTIGGPPIGRLIVEFVPGEMGAPAEGAPLLEGVVIRGPDVQYASAALIGAGWCDEWAPRSQDPISLRTGWTPA